MTQRILIGVCGVAILIAAFLGYFFFKSSTNTEKKASVLAEGKLTLYLYRGAADLEGNAPRCSEDSLIKVERQVGAENANIPYAVAILLSGDLTEEERAAGFVPLFPSTIWELSGSDFTDGILTLSFARLTEGDDRCSKLAGEQILKTLKEFPSVKDVRFEPEETFK